MKNLWIYRKNVLGAWLFFFVLSLVGNTPHSIILLFLISGMFAIVVTLLSILYVNIK